MTDSVTVRPKRTKNIPKSEIYIFSSCNFYPNVNDTSEPLHRVLSDKMGENFLDINLKTQYDHVRTCVSELYSVASALVKSYHRNCLWSARRAFTSVHDSRSNSRSFALYVMSSCFCPFKTLFQNVFQMYMSEM